MFDSLRAAWLRVGRWPRLTAAAACLLLAALSAAGAARGRAAAGAPVPTVAVAVTSHAVAAGQVLRAGDVRVRRWPRSVHPPVTPANVRAVVGRRSAGALTAGEPLTAPRLLGAGITTGLPATLGAVPLEVAAGRSAEYVHAGDHVDVLAGPGDTPDDGPGRAEVVAADATVLSVLPGSEGQATMVVIAADRATALRVTGRDTSGSFTLVVIPP